MEAKRVRESPYLFTAEKFKVIKRGKDKIIIQTFEPFTHQDAASLGKFLTEWARERGLNEE